MHVFLQTPFGSAVAEDQQDANADLLGNYADLLEDMEKVACVLT